MTDRLEEIRRRKAQADHDAAKETSGLGARGKVGRKRMGSQNITFEQWMSQPHMMVRREEVVMFSQFQLTEQIMPLVAQSIQAYEYARCRRVWYRRAWAWLGEKVLKMPPPAGDRERYLALAAEEREDAAEVPEAVKLPEVELPKTCVVCGSREMSTVNARGGLKCHNNHVLVDPPAEPATELKL